MAAEPGFEPRRTESESAVLPLHNSAMFILSSVPDDGRYYTSSSGDCQHFFFFFSGAGADDRVKRFAAVGTAGKIQPAEKRFKAGGLAVIRTRAVARIVGVVHVSALDIHGLFLGRERVEDAVGAGGLRLAAHNADGGGMQLGVPAAAAQNDLAPGVKAEQGVADKGFLS